MTIGICALKVEFNSKILPVCFFLLSGIHFGDVLDFDF